MNTTQNVSTTQGVLLTTAVLLPGAMTLWGYVQWDVLRDMPEVAKQYLAHWQSRWAQGQDWQSTY